jgi:hypothetical protein
VTNVFATTSNTIRVYFSKAVQFGTINNFAQIATVSGNVYGNGANIAISNPVAAYSTKDVYDFNVAVPFTDTNLRYLVFNPTLDLADFSDLGHIVGMIPNHTSPNFAGYPSAISNITNINVISSDQKTLAIYYPEAMMNSNLLSGNTGDTLAKANYDLYNASTGGTMILDNGIGTSWFQTHVVDSKMDVITNKVTFTFDQALPNFGALYYLKFAPTLENALNTKLVKNSDNSSLRAPFALVTSAAAKVTVSSVTYASGVLTIKLSQKVKSATDMNQSQANLLKEIGITLIKAGSNYVVGAPNDVSASTAITSTVAFDTIGADTITVNLSGAIQSTLASMLLIKVGIATGGTNDFIGLNGETCDLTSFDIFYQL